MPPEVLAGRLGTLPPADSVRIQRAFPPAFFDQHLRHRGTLLKAPTPAFPRVTYLY